MNHVVIGLGGVGSALLEPLARFLAFSQEDEAKLRLVDGDDYEIKNLERQFATLQAVGRNKAVYHAQKIIESFQVATMAIDRYVTAENIDRVIEDGDIVFGCVDNHKTRRLIQEHCLRLENVIFISGGNEYTDGNVQLYVAKNRKKLTQPIWKFHPEIEYPRDKSPSEMSCEELQVSEPQLLFTNLMVATLMLNTYYGCLQNRVPQYTECYFDILSNSVRPVKRK